MSLKISGFNDDPLLNITVGTTVIKIKLWRIAGSNR